MKKFLAFALSATMLLGLTACGGDKEKEPENSVEVEMGEEITSGSGKGTTAETATPDPTHAPTPTPTAAQTPSYQLKSTRPFNGGYAMVRFYDEANRVYCCGIINEKGKLQYFVADNGADDDLSKNGYLYFRKNQAVYGITPKGKVVTYQLGDNLSLAQAGDGYVVILEYKSGFDAVEYVYHIYDDAGKEVTAYSSGSQRAYNIYYVGEKTFLFISNKRDDGLRAYGNNDTYYGDIYFGENGTWLKDQVVTYTGNAFRNYTYQDGIFLFRGATHSGSSNTHPGEFAYTDNKGNIKTFTVPQEVGDRPYCLGHSDGVMAFWGYSDNKRVIYCYDMAADTWSSYTGQYVDKLVSQDPVVGGGYVAMILRGADGKTYTMVLDKKAGEVWDAPILGTPTAILNGKVLTMDGGTATIYDLKGKELGKIERYGSYDNQAADPILGGGQNQYFTLEGKEAFTVDLTSGKEIKLPTEG